LGSNGTTVAIMLTFLILLVGGFGYIVVHTYCQKKYFHINYEKEYGKSTLPGAVHDKTLYLKEQADMAMAKLEALEA